MSQGFDHSNDRHKAFHEGAAEILQVDLDEIGPETRFREDIPEWDSLRGFAMLILMEDVYGVRISEEQFMECETLSELMAISGIE